MRTRRVIFFAGLVPPGVLGVLSAGAGVSSVRVFELVIFCSFFIFIG